MPIAAADTDLAKSCTKLQSKFKRRNAGFDVMCKTHGTLDGKWDVERLKQAVSNLLLNAIQHGTGKQVVVSVSGDENSVVLTVHNDGPPISATVAGHDVRSVGAGPDS